MEPSAAASALFAGADIDEEARAKIQKNFEALLSKSTLAGAAMTMDADVVLVAAAADGTTEERVRASSAVLTQTSSGFRGVLQESPGEIKLMRPGGTQALHPMAAVRFVMSVVHAAAAREDAATALEVEEAPPLEILLAACQIADCWDCPAVMAAAARCVKRAAAAESEPARVASALVKLLRLVPLDRNGSWLQLREAVEATIATVLPFFWIPSVLKAFDLESACRVIGLIEDLPIELKTLELKGATALYKAWYDEANESITEADLKSEAVPYPDARPTGGRKRAERRLGGNFHLTVSVVDANEKLISSGVRCWSDMRQPLPERSLETGLEVPEFLETENAECTGRTAQGSAEAGRRTSSR